jgi:hypothetical protein
MLDNTSNDLKIIFILIYWRLYSSMDKSTSLFLKSRNISDACSMIKEICEKMEGLISSYNDIQDRIDKSKKNNVLVSHLDHFVPLLQDISKKSYSEYFKLIDIMAEMDNEFVNHRKKINDEIILLLHKQANRDGQNVLGVFNHPDEINHDEIIEKVKKGLNEELKLDR